LLATDLGFRAENVVAVQLASIDTTAAARIQRAEFLAEAEKMPGVSGVATAGCVPYDLDCLFITGVRTVADADALTRPVDVELHNVSAGYFRTLGISISAGRPFTAEDTTVGRTRVVISESAARRLFGSVSPIGKQIVFDGRNPAPMDVVGVARDVRFRSVEVASSPAVYFLSGENPQSPRLNQRLFVRTSTGTGVAIAVLTRAIRDGGVPVGLSNARPLTDIVRAVTSSTRFIAMLLVGFAVSAALLAALGVYGVTAYIITQRTREFGVRLVLGANEGALLFGVVQRGVALVGGGVAIGAVVAAGASRLIAALLYGVGSFDMTTYAVVIAIVTTIGLLATFIPARRIARIDPANALRA
jgi:putative ABC transport system permease protein